jgi:multiple sugar transport system substrate-binding protein
MGRQLNRRTFLWGTFAVGIGATAACTLGGSSSGGNGKLTIEYWNLFGGGDGANMTELVNGFNQSQNDVHVNATTLAWGTPYYTKLTTSTIAGSPPDVAIMHLSRMASFGPTNIISAIDESMLAGHGVGASDITPRQWQEAHFGNNLLAVPLDTHPMVMYYNKTLAGKAGLLGSDGQLKPLSGSDAVLGALKAVMNAGAQWGVSTDTEDVNPWRVWLALYSQLGGSILSSDGKSLVLDDGKGLQASSFLRELTIDAKVAQPVVDGTSCVALFGQQKAGFFFNGEWELPTFQTAGIPFDMTLFPQIFDNASTWADSHSFVIPRRKSPDKDRLNAVMSFIAYVLKNSITWAKGGHIPSYQPIVTSAEYKSLEPQAHYADEANHVVYDPIAWWSGAAGPMETSAGAALQGVFEGHLTAEQGYSKLKTALQSLLQQQAPAA